MKIKTENLIGPALDWTVAECEAHRIQARRWGKNVQWLSLDLTNVCDDDYTEWSPSYDWAQAGSIIEREGIMLERWKTTGHWQAANELVTKVFTAKTPLIAAMRCYVASKMGDEVEVPEELA